jgi:hypothetical protein
MVEKQANKQARYGLRKLNIGVASILLGLSFLGAGSISADELNNTTEANVENVAPAEEKSINGHKIRECKNVKRTINFFQDGKLIDSITQSADFYRYNIWNLETNELIASTQWRDTTTYRTEHYFDAVDVPEIAGYTADQTKIENTTVTGNSTDQVINVNYTATTEEQIEKKPVKRVIRLAKDGVVFKEIPQEFIFTRTNIVNKQTGQIVQTGTWNQSEYTFAAVDIEQLENYTASQNRVEALTVDPESPDSVVEINYTAAQKVEDEFKTVERLIEIYHEGVKVDVFTQKVEFKRIKTTNLATGEVTYGAWDQAEGLWSAFDAPVYDNYETDTIKVDNKTVTPDTANETARIDYTAKRENLTEEKVVKRVINIYKDGQKVDQHVQSVTFKRTNIKNLATGEITYGEWDEPTKMLDGYSGPEFENYDSPSNNKVYRTAVSPATEDIEVNMYYTAKVATSIEQKTVVRTIQMHFPDGTLKKVTQQVTFKREVKKNMATGEEKYGAWDMEKITLPKYQVDQVENYEPTQSVVEAVKVTPETESWTVDIYYNAKIATEVEQKIVLRRILMHFPDGTVKEVTQQVAFKREVKTNLATGEKEYGAWDMDKNTLPAYKVDQVENYEPSQSVVEAVVVTPETETLTVNIHYNAKTTTEVEERVALRQILLHFPDGTVKEVTQQVTFKREVKTNLATGEKEYGAWDIEEGTLPEYQVEQVENYEPNQSVVEAMAVTPETAGNWTVDIYYNAKTATEVEERVALRQILLHFPDGTVKEVTQQVTFKREVKTNLATGEKEYGAWDIEEGNLPEYQVDQVENYEPSHSVVEAMVVTPETSGNWTVDIHYNAKTTTRTEYYTAKRVISLVKDGKKVDEITQSVLFKREVTKNLATGEETFGDWSTDNDSWEAFVAPSFENYIADIPQLEAVKVDPNTKDTEVTINYTAATKEVQETRTVKRVINIYRDGKKVDEITQRVVFTRTNIVNLATGEITYGAWDEEQKHFAEYEVPEVYGYEPEEKIISAMAVDPEMQDTTANVNYKSIVTTEIEEKVVDRKIILNLPNGMTREHIQSVTFKREVYKNLATGEMTYGAWDIPQATLEAYQVPGFSGYVASVKHIEALEVTADSESTTVVVDYYQQSKDKRDVFRIFNIQVIDGVLPRGKQQYTQKVTFTRDIYLDANGNVVGHGDWEQTELTFEDFEIPQREGYATFRSVIAGQKVTADSGNLESEITYVAHANDTETKEVNRKVTIIWPDGSTHEEIQKVTFVRDKVTNQISGETSYGNWLPETENSEFPEILLPDIAGYKPSQTVDRLDVTSDMANSEVTVTYERDSDAGETTPDVPGNGEVTPDVPGNGETTPDAPDAGETTPDVPDAGETAPDTPGNGETTPDVPGNGETTPDAPDTGETTPDTPGNGEVTPDTPDAGETTPDVPGNGETIPDTPDAGETMPDTPGDGETTPDTPDAGETTPDTPGNGEVTSDVPSNGETTSGTPEAGADSDSDDTDQSDLGMKPEIGADQTSPSKMKNNGSSAKVSNMANSPVDKATKNNAVAGTELPNLGDETAGLKGLGALLAAMACAPLFMAVTAKKRKN